MCFLLKALSLSFRGSLRQGSDFPAQKSGEIVAAQGGSGDPYRLPSDSLQPVPQVAAGSAREEQLPENSCLKIAFPRRAHVDVPF